MGNLSLLGFGDGPLIGRRAPSTAATAHRVSLQITGIFTGTIKHFNSADAAPYCVRLHS
jgi:hypothetical protein